MASRCTLVHSIRGRLRARLDSRSWLVERGESLQAEMEQLPGIGEVRLNCNSRSVIIRYDPEVWSAEVLVARLEAIRNRQPREHGASDLPVPEPERSARVSEAAAEASPMSTVLPWHALPSGDVLRHWESDGDEGLATGEVQRRWSTCGLNTFDRPRRRSRWAVLWEQFSTLPVALLTGSAILSLATGGVADAAVIMTVVGVNGLIGNLTENEAEDALASLFAQETTDATVVRDGRTQSVDSAEVVPGDVLLLAPGTRVVADGRLLSAERLLIDESTLTGESLPVAKGSARLPAVETPLRDRTNMVYRGTMVTGGSGRAVVVAGGRHTEAGKIERQISAAQRPQTPVQRQLNQLGTTLGIGTGAVCGALLGVGLVRGVALLEMLKATTALAVAAVPEGLPMIATTTLALGVRRMRQQRVIVRRLDAVETLGSVQVFCMDKTGTLTRNRMTARQVFVAMRPLRVEPDGIFQESQRINGEASWELRQLLETIALCNETRIVPDGTRLRLDGSPTETALMDLSLLGGVDVERLRGERSLLKTQYRTESQGFMTTTHRLGRRGSLLAVKGRPSEVLPLCRWQLRDGQRVPLDEADRTRIEAENDRMAGDALRVLGAAQADGREEAAVSERDLTWLGLVGIADPIRPGVAELIEVLHGAGIRTTMITGDQSATAYAIAKQLRLGGDRELQMLDSKRLEEIDPEVLKSLAQRVHVFSAVSPSHKLQIVRALQRAGIVVAMTGDGVNDGPALKTADVGVAMGGERSAEIAQMTADVVLADNNLETMINAVRQGRTIYDNTRSAIQYLLATNLSEILVMFGGVASGAGQPLTPMQLLWINLVSDVFPVLALAIQPPEDDTLQRPPRDPHEPFLGRPELLRVGTQAAAITAGGLATYGWAYARYGPGPRAGTLAYLSLTSAQLLHMLCVRSPRHSLLSAHRPPLNRLAWLALLGGLALTLLPLGVGPLRRILGLAPISLLDAGVAALGAVLPLIINESVKLTGEALMSTPEHHEPEAGPTATTVMREAM